MFELIGVVLVYCVFVAGWRRVAGLSVFVVVISYLGSLGWLEAGACWLLVAVVGLWCWGCVYFDSVDIAFLCFRFRWLMIWLD